MNDEEKLNINYISIRNKKIEYLLKKNKKSNKSIFIVTITIILLLVCLLSYIYIFKGNDKIKDILKEKLEGKIKKNDSSDISFKNIDEFFNYQKEIELKNEEYENNVLNTNIIKNKLDKIKIYQENNTLIKNNTYMNLLESKENRLEVQNYIEKIMNTTFSLENLKNFYIIKKPKISIIIPFHNSEKFLKNSIISIQDQAFKDIEIIYVDDFSTDNSTELIKEFQKKDQRIVLLKNKRKRGPFYSRNKGAIFSRGDYIQFVDADDILVGNILEKAYNIAMNKKVDIVQYAVLKEKGNNNLVYINERTHKDIIYQPELSDQMYYGKGYLFQANLYIFNKLIKKVAFYDGLISMGDDVLKEDLYMQEDAMTLFCLLRVANSLIIIEDIGYYYMFGKNPKSLMMNVRSNFANQILHDNFLELKLIFNKTKNNEHDKDVCSQYFQMILNLHTHLIPFVTQGFELIDEVLDLLINCPYIKEYRKYKFRNFKSRLPRSRNNLNLNKTS